MDIFASHEAAFAARSGVNRLRIGKIGGRRLAAGNYQATVRARGSVARPLSVRFAIAPP